jgi:inosine/xanthosine triphosphate pyrophosphatase family protein
VLDWLRGQEDRSGYFELGLVYALPGGEMKEFVTRVPARIVDSPREGDSDFGWDSIIALGESELAISQYPPEERYRFFTGNFEKLGQSLLPRSQS